MESSLILWVICHGTRRQCLNSPNSLLLLPNHLSQTPMQSSHLIIPPSAPSCCYPLLTCRVFLCAYLWAERCQQLLFILSSTSFTSFILWHGFHVDDPADTLAAGPLRRLQLPKTFPSLYWVTHTSGHILKMVPTDKGHFGYFVINNLSPFLCKYCIRQWFFHSTNIYWVLLHASTVLGTP